MSPRTGAHAGFRATEDPTHVTSLLKSTPSILPRDSRHRLSPRVGVGPEEHHPHLDLHAAAIHREEARVVRDLLLHAPRAALMFGDAREILGPRVHVHPASREGEEG